MTITTVGFLQMVPATRYLNGVACPSNTVCEALGDDNQIPGVAVPVGILLTR
jgi:hypothetical protein